MGVGVENERVVLFSPILPYSLKGIIFLEGSLISSRSSLGQELHVVEEYGALVE